MSSTSQAGENRQIPTPTLFDKWTLTLGLVGVVLGVVFAITSGLFGILVLAALAGGFALILVVLKPDMGVALVLIFLLAQVQRVFVEVNGWPGLGRPLVAFMVGVVALRFLIYNERPASWMQNNFILGIYALSLLMSVVTANNSIVAFDEFQNIFESLLVASIILFIVQRSSSLRVSIWAVVFAGIFMASISVFQNLTQTFDNNYYGFGGWEYSGYVGRPRVTGPYETPNPYAQILCVIFVLALERAWHEKKTIIRLISLLGAGVIALALIYTDSRGGFLCLAFTLLVFLLFNPPNFNSIVIIIALGVVLVRFMPANYTERLFTLTEIFSDSSAALTDESFRGRTSENIAAWRMFLDNPVFGVGLENYSNYYLEYSRQIGLDPRREARDPASLYLQLLANQGLIGAVVYIGMIYVVFLRLYRARKNLLELGHQDEANIASALFASLAGYMFMSLYKNSAYTNAFWSLMALCMAVSQLAYNLRTDYELNRTSSEKAA